MKSNHMTENPENDYELKKLNNPLYAALCLWQGLLLLRKPQLRRYILIPIAINLLLFGGAFGLAAYFFADFLTWLIPQWLGWLHWLLWPLFGAVFILITFFSFTLAANLLASPFYDRLAERAEAMIIGSRPKPEEEKWLRAAGREMTAELSRLAYFLIRIVPLGILSLIPAINLIAPFLWLVFNAWFLAIEYSTYYLANHGLRFPQQRKILSKAKFGAITMGGLIALGIAVPVLNVLVPPAAVVGATLYFVNARRQTGSPIK